MHLSEAHLDAPPNLRRVRVHGFNDSAAGVAFVDGEAQSGVPPIVVARMRAIGFRVEDLGPWSEPPSADAPATVTPDVAEASPLVAEMAAPLAAQRRPSSDEDAESSEKTDDVVEALSLDDRPRRRGIR